MMENDDLLSLLRWKTSTETVSESLNALEQVDGAEKVKFL